MPLPRPCDRCGERFTPNSHVNRLCEDCANEAAKLSGSHYKGKKRTRILKTMFESLELK